MELRDERPGDRESVRHIHRRAFGDHGPVVADLPEYRKRGIGSALIRHGLARIERSTVPLVFLEGDPDYCSRFGFLPDGEHGFRKPSLRIPDAAFQVITLPAYEPWMTGTLVYAEAFWRHDAVGRRE